MLVAIPSKGRAGQTKSDRILPSAVMFVPESEAEAYRKLSSVEVRSVPQSVSGITRTRNWILDNTDDPWVVMVDDDVKRQGWVRMLDATAKHLALDEQEWLEVWARLFDVTHDVGYRVWGVATNSASRAVYPFRPFLWQTYVTASCMGIINDGRTRFDESYPVKEDYELCLRCIKEDGGIVGARYVYWENAHWTGEGGCKDYRTQGMEMQVTQRLIREYPGLIRRVTRGGSQYSIELDF